MDKQLNNYPQVLYPCRCSKRRHGYVKIPNGNKMVEVFKTNVQEDEQSQMLIDKLCYHFPHCRINFDLEDCDKILRIEGNDFSIEIITTLIKSEGYECEVLI